jgi:hypothetical protein
MGGSVTLFLEPLRNGTPAPPFNAVSGIRGSDRVAGLTRRQIQDKLSAVEQTGEPAGSEAYLERLLTVIGELLLLNNEKLEQELESLRGRIRRVERRG